MEYGLVVECLPGTHEALGLIPTATKERKGKKNDIPSKGLYNREEVTLPSLDFGGNSILFPF